MTKTVPKLTTTAQEVFDRRYSRNEESVSDMFSRVAKHVSGAEDKSVRAKWSNIFYDMMANLEFLPNSPTLFNAGTDGGVLSACFVLVVEDSLDSIMECHRLSGKIQKYGGGVGYYLGHIRAAGELVSSVHGKACGPVSLLDYYNALSTLITQGGRRAGAQMGILPIDHPDINSFINAKNDSPESLYTFNISVSITDKFMREYESGEESAKEKMKMIAEAAWRTGDPGCFFVDTANKRNPTPWLGNLEGTNPCGEAPLYHAEACNLGSINLTKFINKDHTDFDWERLAKTAQLAVRFLDNVITTNTYPDPAITEAVLKTRKIGLGVMGWADALAMLGIHYDSEAAVSLGERLMNHISGAAGNESVMLGKEKGSLTDTFAPRNATRTSIAPTGTISILAGCSSGIEPHYKLEYTRTMFDRGEEVKLHIVEPIVPYLKSIGSDLVPKTSHEISPLYHIRHQAAFQKHTDLAVSKTINMPEDTTPEEIEEAYVELWKQGCSGGTVYRDKSRDVQVLSDKKEIIPDNGRERLPDDHAGSIHKFKVGDQKGRVIVGYYPDGRLGEFYIETEKEGSTVAGMYDALAIVASLAIQYHVPLEVLSDKLIGMRFEPYGMTTNPEIPTATSIVDYLFRFLRNKFGDGQKVTTSSGLFCPDCTSRLVDEEGCLHCENKSCGFSRC